MGRKKKPTDSPSSQLAGIYPPGKMKLVQQTPEALTVGERLRRERVLRKMTMEELADYMGISTTGAATQPVKPAPEVFEKARKIVEKARGTNFIVYFISDEPECRGISPAYLGAVERGQRPLSNRLMKKLHDRLGISYDYLLEGITISGNMISQFVRESEIYTTNRNLNILLNVCTQDELDSCYNLVHTYLKFIREKAPERTRASRNKPTKPSVPPALSGEDEGTESLT